MGGYQHYLEALFDLRHEDHQNMLAWGGRFDPEYFPIARVNKILREAFPVRSQAAGKHPARKASAVSLPQESSAAATSEEDFDAIVRSLIRSRRLPPQKFIRG
jgi:hypothetical protein